MSENRKSCDFFKLAVEDIVTDRVIIGGRRGTGKSTGAKLLVASGLNVLWCARTKPLTNSLPARFVPPAVSDVLPKVEPIDSDPEMPAFRFGDGAIQTVALSMIAAIRDTGVSVDGHQAELIILDECFPPDGRYKRDEPQLLDDLAATVGRSGKLPPILCLGNPISNRNPYSYKWEVNVMAEGLYTDSSGRVTQVRGTSDCRDCFGRKIGVDAQPAVYAAHIDRGGDLVVVNGRGLRIRSIGGWLYVGSAKPDGVVIMQRDHYTPEALTSAGTRFLMWCKQSLWSDRCVFDSFQSELLFYELLRAKE